MINNAEKKVFINYLYIDNLISILEKDSKNEELVQCLKKSINFLREINLLFPKFIKIDNIELKTKYTKKEIEDNSKPKTMLKYLLDILGITLEQLKEYWNLTSDSDQYNFQDDIDRKIDEKLIQKFNEFYKQEKIEFKVHFDNDSISFLIRTNKKFLSLDERSNGLKWYLNMYIQLLARTKESSFMNYIVLLDEPGVYLHVNAQKRVLDLFENFVSNENQIIYTTQLPTMIYQNNLNRVRLIIKDEEGNSNISNKYYILPHGIESKEETITPIIISLGMQLKYNFTGIESSKVNIVTEGVSDHNYIKAFLLQNKYEKEYNIIPSAGVSNIHNIISILTGWGYDYKIIIDQDKEGRKEYNILTQKLLVNPDSIRFVDGSNTVNSNNYVIEDLFSEEDKETIGINNEDYNNEKAFYSLEILKKVENKEYKYSKETIDNFEKIINNWLN